MENQYGGDKPLSDCIRDALHRGEIEETPEGRYRTTEKGYARANHMLATNRSARAFYREMNRLYQLPDEHGLPDWQGEGDEF